MPPFVLVVSNCKVVVFNPMQFVLQERAKSLLEEELGQLAKEVSGCICVFLCVALP